MLKSGVGQLAIFGIGSSAILASAIFLSKGTASQYLDAKLETHEKNVQWRRGYVSNELSRTEARKAEWNIMNNGDPYTTMHSVKKNGYFLERMYNHVDEDPYAIAIQQYDEALTNPQLPKLKYYQYGSPAYWQLKEKQKAALRERSKQEREAKYRELVKAGLIQE